MHIVVVGGGFGGVKAAKEIAKRKIGKVTLVSDEPYFLHHATLYATATGKNMAESVIPLAAIFDDQPDVTVVQDSMTALDTTRRIVVGKKKQYKYDALVIAIGSVTTYFNIDGVAQHAFGIKTLDEIERFQAHMQQEVVEKRLDKEFFVIGAGPTGVELAGALNDYLKDLKTLYRLKGSQAKVTLVEAAPRILPQASQTAANVIGRRLKKLGIKVLVDHKVEALDDDQIKINGKKYPTSTAIWTAGMSNHPFFAKHDHLFHLEHNGRVNVTPYLEAMPGVYVVGDNNTVKYGGMAWPTLKQATFVAKDLLRKKSGRTRFGFRPTSVPSGLPVGKKWGYVEWHGIYVAGFAGYLTRRWMEYYGYRQLVSREKALPIWRAHNLLQVDN